uniref:Uncharacterized protein n=1 Tax=Anguilla anguilla TaxID=7936 RepID=A0A0E9WDE4_ANGAN
MMRIICHGLRRHQISTQSNTYGRVLTGVLDSDMRAYLSEKLCSTPPAEFQRLAESMPRRSEAILTVKKKKGRLSNVMKICKVYFIILFRVYSVTKRTNDT